MSRSTFDIPGTHKDTLIKKWVAYLSQKQMEHMIKIGKPQTQNAFARYLKVSETNMSKWMNGNLPDLQSILILSRSPLIGLEIFEILDMEDFVVELRRGEPETFVIINWHKLSLEARSQIYDHVKEEVARYEAEQDRKVKEKLAEKLSRGHTN